MDKNGGTGSTTQGDDLESWNQPQEGISNELDSPSQKRQKISGFASQQIESETFQQGAGSGLPQPIQFQPQPQLQQQQPQLQGAFPWGLQPQLQQPYSWGLQPQLQQQQQPQLQVQQQQSTWTLGSHLPLQAQQPQTQSAWISGHQPQVQQQQTQLQPQQQVICSWGPQTQFQLQPPQQQGSWLWGAQSQLQQPPLQQLPLQFQQQQSQPQVHQQGTWPWAPQSQFQQQPQSHIQQQQQQQPQQQCVSPWLPQSPFQQQQCVSPWLSQSPVQQYQTHQQIAWVTQPQTQQQQLQSQFQAQQPLIQHQQPQLQTSSEQQAEVQQLQPQSQQQLQPQTQIQQQQPQLQIKSEQLPPKAKQSQLKSQILVQQSQLQSTWSCQPTSEVHLQQSQPLIRQPQQPQIQIQQPQQQIKSEQRQSEIPQQLQMQLKSEQQPQIQQQQTQPLIQERQFQLQVPEQQSQPQFQQSQIQQQQPQLQGTWPGKRQSEVQQLQPQIQKPQLQPQMQFKSEKQTPQPQPLIQQQQPQLQGVCPWESKSEVQLKQSQSQIQQQQIQPRIQQPQSQLPFNSEEPQPQIERQQPRFRVTWPCESESKIQQPQLQPLFQQQPLMQSKSEEQRPQIQEKQLQEAWLSELQSEVQPQQLQPPVQLKPTTIHSARGDPQEQNLQQRHQERLTQQQLASGIKFELGHQPRGWTPFASVEPLRFAQRIYAAQKSGRVIQVATNFFPLTISNPNITVFHYDVIIEPDKPKHLFRKVWKEYVSLIFPGRLTAFDGRNAYSNGPLTKEKPPTAIVTVFNEDDRTDKEFKVAIKEVRRVSFSCFKDYRARMLQDRSLKVLPEAETAVLDIILRNWASDNLVRSNSTFFPLSATTTISKDLSKKLTLRFGYFQSAFLGYSSYLNFDVSHRAFYKECSLLNVLLCFKNPDTKTLEVDEMNHFIKNVKVEYQLPNDILSRRIYRVNKLVGDANTQTFTKENGMTLSVAQYFSLEKKCNLKYPQLPLLWVGPNQKTIYLPMEFCKIVPDQVYRGLMDPFETREMVKSATSNARDRHKQVNDVFRETNINSHPLMKEFGLKVSDKMEKVPARILDAPGLKTSRNIRVKDGMWRIQEFLEPKHLNKWCILVLDRRVSKESVMRLQRSLRDKGNEFNMRIAEAARNPIEGEPSAAALKKTFSQLKDMEMVFVIISEAKGLYSRVKTICETQEGILTQCIKSRTVSQDPSKLRTTVENILLKVNAKLGGKNHCLDEGSSPPCLNGYVMVAGADVSHPRPGMSSQSIVAVTATCDPASFQYSTVSRIQPKSEIIKDLEEIMSIHVKKFKELRGKYPEKIIFFRDGVSEGEMEKVLKGELSAVKRACNPHCQPKITFVIVQKRHHTRFYPINPSDEQGRNYNVPVGTCVDSNVVHPRDFEFYLVSHASILGTARPTRYRLLHDDNKLTDDELERLSFYLCHLYSKCNRSVSYPSPTYNAHLATARVRAYLEGLSLNSENVNKENIGELQQIPDRISKISPMFFV